MHMPGAHGGQKKSTRFPGTGVTNDYETPCGIWEPSPGLLEEALE